MISLYKQVLDPSFRKPFGNVTRWFNTVVNQPNFKAVSGAVELCTKMAEFDSKKFAEFSGKGEKKKEEKKKRRSLRNLQPLLRRSPIPLRKCPREPLTWKSGRGFIPTMTNPSRLPGPGSTLTTRTTPFGEEITSTTTSSPWCSCPVISSVECSSVWTNSIRMLFHLFVCLARTTTLPSLESGCSRVTSSLSSWMTTGRSTTPATPGGNWRASQMRPRNWLINTGSGRAQMRKAGNSTREKSSSNSTKYLLQHFMPSSLSTAYFML